MPKRNTAHMAAQRERVIRATIRCIGQVGIERASIARICKEAQLSAGAIYTYFGDKEEIIAAALSFGAVADQTWPDDWPAMKAGLTSLEDQVGFDITTVAAAKLQLFSSGIHPGKLHDALKPMVDGPLNAMEQHLNRLQSEGRITLKVSPRQTAIAFSAIMDSMIWIALANDTPLQQTAADMSAILDCFVTSTDPDAR